MKKRLAFCYLLCGLCFSASRSGAQDIHFSQFYETAILRNPALTGIFSGDYKLGVNYRTQWTDLSVPFQTALVSGETRILVNRDLADYVSFGIVATYDKAGSINFTSMQVYPAINYNKALEDVHNSYLSVGFAGGYEQRSVDESKMTFSSQYVGGNYSSLNPSGENMTFTPIHNYDLSAGVSLNSSLGTHNRINYYLGLAAYHITRPSETFQGEDEFIRLNTKWEANFGFKYSITEQYALTVHFNYSNQAPYQEIIGGGFLSWRSMNDVMVYNNFTLYLGLFYRLHDAIIPTVKFDYHNYSVTFSYDDNTSTLKPASTGVGGYEISLFMRGWYKKNINLTDAVRCPRFEETDNSAFQ
jgi:type IX secretion system PorP/SprF family membrane protein